MKKTIVLFLVLLSLIALILRFNAKFAEVFLGFKESSGISIASDPTGATVFLDGQEVGKTPLNVKNLSVKTYEIKIQKEKLIWQVKVTLTPGTVTVINRDLSADLVSSAGEMLTLEKGKGLTIVSNPTEADVEVDGKQLGKTPVTTDVESGEHTILISSTNYLKRSIRANLPESFNLTISADLSLSEADLTAAPAPVVTQTPEVVVKTTPTGFLRVRDKPSLAGKELVQVKTGETLVLLEEQGAWDKVRLVNGTEGFVSAVYVEKKKP
ncbi:MAG: PEGA domain-containing protein [Candidatus Daviesbacteria bacterium]|nr:PEGA domain-containing protein [Candidatus Daviesbacteria bacterium]